MLPPLKAEFRKLFSVRSTYVIIACSVLLVLFFAGFVEGFKADASALRDSGYLASAVRSAVTVTAILATIVGILLFSHEYRYNTILYTLTSSNSRSKVLVAKILAMTGFAVVFILCMGALSPVASYVGTQLAGHDLAAQSLPYGDLLWRGLFYAWAYAMAGLALVALTRSQVFSIVALFFIPTIEGLLALLLKDNAVYLPFTALSAVMEKNSAITQPKAALVFLAWLVGSWIIAWVLFLRRDAN